MMMTSDISLLHDPEGSYQQLVKAWANDTRDFDHAFAHAWYKLTTRDMGPVSRCVGQDVPPVQAWQNPLPEPPSQLANFTLVKQSLLQNVLRKDAQNDHAALLLRLAWQCSSSFRQTDYLGGCNGARIRFSPQKDWPVNQQTDRALALLEQVKDEFGESLSWADLIVLAGNVAVEFAGGPELPFCGGRTDAVDGQGSEYLMPAITNTQNDTAFALRDSIERMGLTPRQMTALNMASTALARQAWVDQPTALISTQYFEQLLGNRFVQDGERYKAPGKALYMLKTDMLFKWDAELLAIAQEFATDSDAFLQEFASGWTQLSNADRFDGPTGNICNVPVKSGSLQLQQAAASEPTEVEALAAAQDGEPRSSPVAVNPTGVAVVLSAGLVAGLVGLVVRRKRRSETEDGRYSSIDFVPSV